MNISNQLNHLKNRKVTSLLVFLCALCLCLVSQALWVQKAQAESFTNSHFIDDALMLDANSMNADGIQAFLASKSGTLKNRSFVMNCDAAGSTAKQMYLSIGAPCGQTISAARIIYYSSQIYGINPQAVLTTMQKEQSLVTNPSPTDRAYNQAMGFACPDSGACSADSNFFYQIDNGTWALRYHYERANGNNTWWSTKAWTCGTAKNYYKPNLYPRQNVNFYDDGGRMYAVVYVDNPATSSLYCYTPHAYNNPQGQYGRPAFGTTGDYYSGSYNFVYYYELWFGSTYAFMYNGVSYSTVFDSTYYLANNSDVRSAYGDNRNAAFSHFVSSGMREGRQGNANFNLTSYRTRYADLRWAYSTDLRAYYWHYSVIGKKEGRIATGSVTLQPVTLFGGVDYSSLYDFNTYLANNTDLRNAYINDDTGALWHFVTYGMAEGRQGNAAFNITSYMGQYLDLRRAYGLNNLRLYYLHFMNSGKAEGRNATGDYLDGTSTLSNVEYSAVYSFDFYAKANADVKRAFGLNDSAALQHFVNTGMNEGRQGGIDFNVQAYRAKNPDLQNAFGNNLKSYYIHYVTSGKAEGRSGK